MENNFQVRDVYNRTVVNYLADNITQAWPEFDGKRFSRSINSKLKSLTFSERTALIRDTLWEYLPKEYPRALEIILQALPPELPDCEFTGYDRFIVLPQNEFVAKYGLEHYDVSIQALYKMTKRFSAEGASQHFSNLPGQLRRRSPPRLTD
jgi:3-methyladenine DNA glycosylase AlkC